MRVLAVAVLLAPGVLACFRGGYFEEERNVAAILAWLALAATLPRALPPGRLALAGLAALTVWTGVSIAWAPDAGAAANDLQRLLLYLPYFALALLVVRHAPAEPWLLLGITGACAYGLADRFGVIDLAPVVTAGDRLAYPLSYWNATGAFAAIGLILAAGRSQPLAAAAAPVLALTLLLTLSRGAIGALAAGMMLLLALSPTRGRLASAAVVLGGGFGAAAILAIALPGLSTQAGADPAGLLALAAAMAGCALAARARPADLRVPRLPAVALAAAAIALVGTVAAVVGREAVGGQRIASAQSNRYAYWEAALEAFAGQPAAGEGSGSFRTIWLRERPFLESVRDAHSLYLETAAELGLVGLAALAALIAGVARRARAPAATAALVAYAVHAGIDWDWEMPALTMVALALAASVITSPAPAAARDGPGP